MIMATMILSTQTNKSCGNWFRQDQCVHRVHQLVGLGVGGLSGRPLTTRGSQRWQVIPYAWCPRFDWEHSRLKYGRSTYVNNLTQEHLPCCSPDLNFELETRICTKVLHYYCCAAAVFSRGPRDQTASTPSSTPTKITPPSCVAWKDVLAAVYDRYDTIDTTTLSVGFEES